MTARAGDIVGDLRQRLGEGYAGVWLNRPSCRFGVGIAPSTDAETARRVFAERDLAEHVDAYEVRWTWTEVEQANDALARRIADLIRARVASAGIGVEGNALTIVVQLCDCATAEQEKAAGDAVAESSVAAVIRRMPSSYFTSGPSVGSPTPPRLAAEASRRISRAALLARGLRVSLRGQAGSAVTVELVSARGRVARARVELRDDGTARIRLRPARADRARLSGAVRQRLRLRVNGRTAGSLVVIR